MLLHLLQLLTAVMVTLGWKFVKTYFHHRKKLEDCDPVRSLPTAATVQRSETPKVNNPPDPSPTKTTTDSFRDAHDFVIENMTNVSYTINHNQREEMKNTEKYEKRRKAEEDERWKKADDALEKLLLRAMPSAMLYSEARAYAPRCDEDTRRGLRAHIVEWGRNDGEIHRLLWLSGPAAVGKSAVAQTAAEELKKAEVLGAVFFFSRPNNRDDPRVVIPTLVYQLAVLLPEYKLFIGQRFKEDPLIFGKDRRSRFQELISDPFLPDLSRRPLTLLSYLSEQLLASLFHRPLFIVLDGLDECNGRDAQREFVEMITRHARRDRNSRIRWMICSRPEPHLTLAFSSTDCRDICRHERLEVDGDEARGDTLRILTKGFTEIREKYPDQLAHDWPHNAHIKFIADRASGHLGFASFIIRFIGDHQYDNPSGQLKACLKFLKCTDSKNHVNPLQALDLLYTQILSDIPETTLPITQRILGLFILYGNERLTALVHANFLGLDQAAFYHSLQRLHSVVVVPPASTASTQPIRIYHTSFSDYLRDKVRAMEFVLDEGAIHLYVATRGLEWLSYFCKDPSDQQALPELTWPGNPTLLRNHNIPDLVCNFAFTPCWNAFPQVPRASLSTLIKALRNFDFNIAYTKWANEIQEFGLFIQWLLSSDAKSLASVDRKCSGEPGKKEEIAIIWDEKDPRAFVEPFLRNAGHADYLSIRVRLRTCTQTSFHLILGRDIQATCQAREDDIVIVIIGPEGSHVLSSLTGEPLRTIRPVLSNPIIQATRAIHPEHGRGVVLVGPLGPSRGARLGMEAINDWLEKVYKNNIKISGIIYVENSIASNDVAESPLDVLQSLCGLCGDLAATRLCLVTNQLRRPSIRNAGSRNFQLKQPKNGPWTDLIVRGVSTGHLASGAREEAERIVGELLGTANTGESLRDLLGKERKRNQGSSKRHRGDQGGQQSEQRNK
ncbi:hypothetical protein D9756_009624 [Leucocoprinus leucothites]|uniref:Nephrocystin 3-like N-terminal domain-containing protein n=1 Tax=Leucocoprinus leucothites TaxID=201217 RepID=A0A8H5CWY3_9AGAR|nr:hypothetical protein D9756_009624 [Leucoagaricus leucothites]